MLYSTLFPKVKKKMQTNKNFFCATLTESDRLTSSTLLDLREAQSNSRGSGMAVLIKSLVNIKEFDTRQRFQRKDMLLGIGRKRFRSVPSLRTRSHLSTCPEEQILCNFILSYVALL
jgi:hypothetical protein